MSTPSSLKPMNKTTQNYKYQTSLNTVCANRKSMFCELLKTDIQMTKHSHFSAVYACPMQ